MAKPGQKVRSNWIAPFGRVGHALGFRWAFFWTFPIPFHPLLFHAVPVAFVAWQFWLVTGDGPINWLAPVWAALILGAILSIPFIQWILLTFRLHLVQAAMLPAALVLLAVAAWRGEAPAWAGFLPPLFLATHAALAIASRTLLGRIQAETEALKLDAREGGLPPVIFEGFAAQGGPFLFADLDLPFFYSDRDDEWRLHIRVDPIDSGLCRRLASLSAIPRSRVSVSGKDAAQVAAIQVSEHPAEAVRVRSIPWQGLRRLLVGPLRVIEMVTPDGTTRRAYDGRAAAVSWFPGFYFLIYLRLGSEARWGPEAGLIRSRQVILGKLSGTGPVAAALLDTIRDPALRSARYPDRGMVDPVLDSAENDRVAEDRRALQMLIGEPGKWLENKLPTLFADPSRYADRARHLVPALARAREANALMAGITLGRLIAALPPEQFAAVGDDLLDALNSKLVAVERPLSEWAGPGRLEDLPFRGFGLLVQAPQLYERLGELGPKALPLVSELGRLFGWRSPLAKAYRAITGQAPPTR